MVSPSSRRGAVKYVVEEGLGSAAQACRAVELARSSYYLRLKPQRSAMKERIIELSDSHPRYGYRRISALLRREGERINPKRVQRIRGQEGLQVRKKQRATRRVGLSTARRQSACQPNHVWSWDIIHDQSREGRSLRMLTLIDEYTRQCLAIEVGRSIRAVDAIRVLEHVIQNHGQPEHIRSDNGPEFIAGAIRDWMTQRQIKSVYINPGSPWEQAHIESFHDKLRDECLNREIFASLKEAAVIIESWRKDYNQQRPHSALGYLTPQEFATAQKATTTPCGKGNDRVKNHAAGLGHGRPQCATYPQSPLSGPPHCCDVAYLSQAFSQHAGPGRLWISLDANNQSPQN
jgi:putative transposase